MSLKIRDIKRIIEEFAPLGFQEEYDNSGFSVGSLEAEVSSILIALDCTIEVIDEAIRRNCNLIITHHPLLFHKPQTVTKETLLGKKLIKLIKNDINLYSCHTNLDIVNGGINDTLMEVLNLENSQVIHSKKTDEFCPDDCGIGRIATLNDVITVGELCNKVKEKLKIDSLRFCGDENKLIRKVAVINGSGQDYFKVAYNFGADCIISGDTTYHYFSDFKELGMAIIDAGHFETEWLPFTVFGQYIQKTIKSLGFNNSVLISECTISPYKYI